MPEPIGQQLRQARQARGLSVEEAAQATRIRVHYLRALEEDDRDSLPSAVQGRGFLRNYASFLGVAAQPLLDQWEGKPVPIPPEPVPQPVAIPEPAVELIPEKPGPVAVPAVLPDLSVGLPPSRAIFIEIGDQLRRQRELLSLSLPEVERYTKLRIHYLKAMEAGDLDNLPSMVQSRGMLNNYARFLNLDADALLNRFADALLARRIEINPDAARTSAKPLDRGQIPASQSMEKAASYPAIRRFLSMDLLVVSGMIVILVAFVIWTASQVMANQPKSVPTLPGISVGLLASTTPTVVLTGSPSSLPPTDAAVAVVDEQPTGTLYAPSGTPSTGLPTLSPGKLQLYIVARQRSWMKIIVDDKTGFIGRAEPGSAYPFNASHRVELITGNAGGLQVYFNQKDFGNLGTVNQVVDLVFTTQGIQTPTSSPTPTQTRTPIVSATPLPSSTPRPSATAQSTVPGRP